MQLRKFFVLYLVVVSGWLLASGCGQVVSSDKPPYFTDPAVKLAELSDASFTTKLFYEAVALEPRLNQAGTHVSMGYWSYSSNRGYLIKTLDQINTYEAAYRGIWDEGTTTAAAQQYPSYIRMNQEYWYERAYPVSGKVSIEGVYYTDPHPVTPAQADAIWGAYSQRYADMAATLRRITGITPESWCYVFHARANRVFYAFELPELRSLEAVGDVYVSFALTTEANWLNAADWVRGTQNAPTPEAATSSVN